MKKLLSIIILVAISLVLGGCASGLVQSQSSFESNPEMGTLIIYAQPSNAIQKNVSTLLVLVDGKKVGYIGYEEKALIQLKTGVRKIQIYGLSLNAYLPLVKPDTEKMIEIEKQKTIIYAYRFQPPSCYWNGFATLCDGEGYSIFTSNDAEPNSKLAFRYSE